jgi:hypothetical protein
MQNNILRDVFSLDEITELLTNLETVTNRQKLSDTDTVVKFSLPISDSIKSKLENSLSMNLSQVTTIPMRWVRGDTPPHIDKGESHFNNTYLIYLTDSIGNLLIDGQPYPIVAGDAHIFSEGLEHSTINTENTDRLMIGPMSETGFPVGASGIYYYADTQINGYGCGFTTYFTYGVDNTITIANIPPPIPDNYWNYTGISDSVIWNPPPGKKFGGWKLVDVNYNNPIGNNDISKIYMPGEVYTVSYLNSTALVPNWVDSQPIMNRMHFTDNSLVYYKKGSLASCGVGTVRNSSTRYKKI